MVVLFGDTCFLIGLKDMKDQHHVEAKKIWNKLLRTNIIKGLNNIIVSEYVMVELFQSLQSHVGFEVAVAAYSELTNGCKVQRVTPSIIQLAINRKLEPHRNHKTKQPPIGLIDAISLVTMERLKTSWILSFDKGFDQIPLVKRIYNENTLPFNKSIR